MPNSLREHVYIGDGSTDVPCFRVVKDQGGLSIAVFAPGTADASSNAEQFRSAGRVHHVVPADYTEGSELEAVVKRRIAKVAAERRP